VSASSDLDLVFYDGSCGLCHRGVRFLIARDRNGSRFRFAPLFGETFGGLVPAPARSGLPDTLVVRAADGRLLVKSAAIVHVLQRVGGSWARAGDALAAMPPAIADCGYDAVARIRHRLFRRPPDDCPVASSEQRERFRP